MFGIMKIDKKSNKPNKLNKPDNLDVPGQMFFDWEIAKKITGEKEVGLCQT